MRVTNHTDAALGIEGISIPAGQTRNVRDLDPEVEKVKARLEAGDISIEGQEKPMYVQTDGLPDDAKAEDYLSDWDKSSDTDKDNALSKARKFISGNPNAGWGGASER